MKESSHTIFICSDSVGETSETVVRATIRQFEAKDFSIKRWSWVKTEDEIRTIMEEAASAGCLVAYTLVLPELREMMRQESIRLNVNAVDIMGPMMEAFVETFNDAPKRKPGLLHQMDDDYFKRVDAIEFAVKSDDGRDTNAMRQAHIVLLGVSRTSKTPLSIYLAHKGYKTANYPIVPEVKPPELLFSLKNNLLVGLTMRADNLIKIRTERLKALGLPYGAQYATLDRIAEELEFAHSLFERLGCPVVDVTEKAIEETAGLIMEMMN